MSILSYLENINYIAISEFTSYIVSIFFCVILTCMKSENIYRLMHALFHIKIVFIPRDDNSPDMEKGMH